MILHGPVRLRQSSPLSRANPLAIFGAAAILMLALFAALDVVTAGIVLAALVATLPLLGVPALILARRGWPLLVAAAAIGFFNVLFAGERAGEVVVAIGPVVVTTGTLETGVALIMRLVGIALAGVVAVAAVDPTALADALVQQARVSPRFAIGALAALRLVPLFAREWQTLGLARRARGVEARSPWGTVRLFVGRAHSLLIGAIRRGSRMALAMDARGFGSRPCRTSAREQLMDRRDWLLLASAACVALAATGVSVAVGSWRFVLG